MLKRYHIRMLSVYKNLILRDLRSYGRRPRFLSCAYAFFEIPGFRAVVYLRLIEHFWYSKHFFIVNICRYNLLKSCGMDVSPGFKIGHNFKIIHPVGSIIGKGTTIGNSVIIAGSVIIGQKYTDLKSNEKYPKIGNGVIIGANVTLIGEIEIQDNVTIGANSLVLSSIPANITVYGLIKLGKDEI